MTDKDNYKQLVSNLADLTVDLAIECEYQRRKCGEIGGFEDNPDRINKHRKFQPPLQRLKSAMDDKIAAEALRGILAAVAQFLR